jgi:hypothetical protein
MLRLFGMVQFWNASMRGREHQTMSVNSEMLWDQLKRALRKKRWGLLSKDIWVLHHCSRTHTATESLRQLKFQALKYPPYSLELTLLAIIRLVSSKTFERLPFRQWPGSGRSGACVACHSTKNIFFRGHIQWKLVDRWANCFEKDGDL